MITKSSSLPITTVLSSSSTSVPSSSTLSSLPRLSNEAVLNNETSSSAAVVTTTSTLPKEQDKKTSSSSSSSSPNIITTPTIKESQRKNINNSNSTSSDSTRRNREGSFSNNDIATIKGNIFPDKNEQIDRSTDVSKRTLHKATDKDVEALIPTIDTSKRIPDIGKRKSGILLDQVNTVVDISHPLQPDTMAESLMSLKSKLGNLQLPRNMAGNMASKSSRMPPTLSTANVVVVDQAKASKNDQIVQERLQQGKALNRKDVNGATMHTFSLWNVKPSSTQSSVQNEQTNALLPTFQFQSQPQPCTSSGFHEPKNDESDILIAIAKKNSKSRGPKAAIDLVNDYDTSDDPSFARERSSSLSNLNDTIDISKYPVVRHNSIGPGSIPVPIPTIDSVGGESGGYDDDFDDEDDDLQNEHGKQNSNEQNEVISEFKLKAGLGSGLALALRNKVGNAKSLTKSTDSLPVLDPNKLKKNERNSDPDITIERTGSQDDLDPECVAYESLSFDVDEDLDSLAYSVEEDEELRTMQTARYGSTENGQKKKLGATYPRSKSANSTKKIVTPTTVNDAFQKRQANPFAAASTNNPFIPIQVEANNFNLTEANLKVNRGLHKSAPVSKEAIKADIQRSIDASSPLSELSHEEKEIETKQKKNSESLSLIHI